MEIFFSLESICIGMTEMVDDDDDEDGNYDNK